MNLLLSLLLTINLVYCLEIELSNYKPNQFMISIVGVRRPAGSFVRDIPDDHIDFSFNMFPALSNGYYRNYKFSSTPEPMIDIESLKTPSLKGTGQDTKYKFNRDDFDIFFNYRSEPEFGCYKSKEDGSPILNRLKEAVDYAKLSIPSYHVVATCTSFVYEKNAKRPQTYTLSYKDIKLGEYEILAKEDSQEKLHGECNLDSLYKYMPDTPHFKEVKKTREPTLPHTFRSNTVENGIQVIKFGDRSDALHTLPTSKDDWEDEMMTVIKGKPVISKEEALKPKIAKDDWEDEMMTIPEKKPRRYFDGI